MSSSWRRCDWIPDEQTSRSKTCGSMRTACPLRRSSCCPNRSQTRRNGNPRVFGPCGERRPGRWNVRSAAGGGTASPQRNSTFWISQGNPQEIPRHAEGLVQACRGIRGWTPPSNALGGDFPKNQLNQRKSSPDTLTARECLGVRATPSRIEDTMLTTETSSPRQPFY